MRIFKLIQVGIALLILPLAFGQEPTPFALTGDYPSAHDPSIARDGATYYVFTTTRSPAEGQLPVRCSSDLHTWKNCGTVFAAIPDWIRTASPKTRTLWAPDISFFNGKFHLYYAYSLFGVNTSGIALATNETLDSSSPRYQWKDEGLVIQSTASDNFNAIDPSIVLDKKGRPWLSFGSFWTGIKMREIDAATGKLLASNSRTYALAARVEPAGAAPIKPGRTADWQAIEAPFVIRHGNFYYLFVSFDLCCRGTRSTYRIMVGRSRHVTGPYTDSAGKRMLLAGGTELLTGNSRWLGPGGESVLQQPEGDYLVFHAYDAITGKPALQISTIVWRDGWPHAALATTGESK